MISIDETALKACRENNQAKTVNEAVDPELGGNSQKYKQLLGAQAKTGDCDEFTYIKWDQSALELVLFNLLQEYDNYLSPPQPDPSTGTIPKPKLPAILDPLTIKMGVGFKAHQKTQNIVQILFVRQVGNIIE